MYLPLLVLKILSVSNDAKRGFLTGYITEEVYVEPFEKFNFPNHMFKLDKALYSRKKILEVGMEDSAISLIKVLQ